MNRLTRVSDTVSRSFWVRGSVVAFMALMSVACSDVYEAQADLYNEYKSRVDTATSYKSMKELNDGLEKELVALINGNSQVFAETGKNAKVDNKAEKLLAKAESEYTRAYLNKYLTYAINEQLALYAGSSSKIADAASYEELSSLDKSLNSALTEINTKSSTELKLARAKKMLQEQFAALDKAQAEYMNVYAAKMLSYVYGKEKEIYDRYLLKLAATEGYERIKELRLFMKSELAIFGNDNAKVYQMVAPGEYATEKAAVNAARENFERCYMSKASLAVLSYQKQIYSGAVEVLAAVKSADELDRVNRAFIDVNNRFRKDNAEELQWIMNAANGNSLYKREIEDVKVWFERVNVASENKAAELGLL